MDHQFCYTNPLFGTSQDWIRLSCHLIWNDAFSKHPLPETTDFEGYLASKPKKKVREEMKMMHQTHTRDSSYAL
jgi:hypothetical protein